MNASHGDSGWDCHLTMLVHPNRCGNSTVCPRLEIGKQLGNALEHSENDRLERGYQAAGDGKHGAAP